MNMKKGIFTILAGLLLTTAAGCGAVNAQAKPQASQSGQAQTAQVEAAVSAGSPEALLQPSGDPNAVHAPGVISRLNGFRDMAAVRYAGGSKLAVLADRLYLLDLSSDTVIAETARPEGWQEDIGFYLVEDGYAVVGTNAGFEMECVFFDKELKTRRSVNLSKETQLDPVFTRNAAVSESGRLIAVNDISSGLYLYDTESGAVSDLLLMDRGEVICGVNLMAFADGDQKIVFLGQRFGASGKTEDILGSVDLNGENLQIISADGAELAKMTAYDSFAVFSQELPDAYSGEAWLYTPDTQKVNKLRLTEAKESTGVQGSGSGALFGTSVRIDGKGFMLRVYETDGGKKLYEGLYACDTDQYRDPKVFILDGSDSLLLYLRPMGSNPYYKVDEVTFRQ